MSNNNNLRRQIITEYISNVEQNNNNMSQMLQLMNTQESTLRDLLLTTENIPIVGRSHQSYQNSRLNSTRNRQFQNIRVRPISEEQLPNLDNIFHSFFSNIPIAPTREDINRAVSTCIFSSIETPNNDSCPISLTRFEDNDEVSIINYCSHIFRKDELENWFQENTRCPLCRYDIRNYTVP